MSVMTKKVECRKWYRRQRVDLEAFQVWKGHGEEVITLEQSLYEVEWRELCGKAGWAQTRRALNANLRNLELFGRTWEPLKVFEHA